MKKYVILLSFILLLISCDITLPSKETFLLYYKKNTDGNSYGVAVMGGKKDSLYIPEVYKGKPVTKINRSEYFEISKIYIPETVTSIVSNAFDARHYDIIYNNSFKMIYIPLSVDVIGYEAFKNCPNLVIYTEWKYKPSGWMEGWNPDNIPVMWGMF